MGLHLALAYKGRALPLFTKVIRKELLETSQTLLEVEILRDFFGWIDPSLYSRVVILADRGFAKVELLREITGYGTHFAIRSPRDRMVLVDGSWCPLEALKLEPAEKRILKDVLITKEHQFKAHIAIRRLKEGQANDPEDDTWYILTDLQPTEIALSLYEKRFWIEEMFRDLKNNRNGFHMDQHQIVSEEIFEKMLLVVQLAYLVLIEEGTNQMDKVDTRSFLPRRKKPSDSHI